MSTAGDYRLYYFCGYYVCISTYLIKKKILFRVEKKFKKFHSAPHEYFIKNRTIRINNIQL